jgi:protocatechuate 3,4-dioxygenase beta subunit
MMTSLDRQQASRWLVMTLAPVVIALAAGTPAGAHAGTQPPASERVCASGYAAATPATIAGPSFRPRSPQRLSLIGPGMTGVRLVVTGVVYSAACRPVAGALVDVWQADARGDYDSTGYRLRGRQLTDSEGRYTLETIVPGEYDGRSRHLHVKVQAPTGRQLTTQLFFPGEPRNQGDPFFRPELLLRVSDTDNGKLANFDFVLSAQ